MTCLRKANVLCKENLNMRPYISNGTHPIETRRYLLGTTEIDKMAQVVTQWIDNRSPGGVIYGKPRLGKSRAIKYLMQVLPAEFDIPMPVFLLNCRQYKVPNENVFFEDVLKDVGHAIPFSGKPNIKRDRLFKFLLERTEASGQNRIILFIDDAQRLFELHYGWLMDIHNELDRADISMTVLLIGQEELLHQKTAFIQSKKAQIVGRFMVHEYRFSGLKKIDDIQSCLACYDNDSIYPADSGWSFTRYFMPDAFDDGFRLEACSSDLYDSFKELRQENGLLKSFEIPMQYFTLAVEYSLRKFGVNGLNVGYLNRNHWKEAIKKSGYIDADKYQNII